MPISLRDHQTSNWDNANELYALLSQQGLMSLDEKPEIIQKLRYHNILSTGAIETGSQMIITIWTSRRHTDHMLTPHLNVYLPPDIIFDVANQINFDKEPGVIAFKLPFSKSFTDDEQNIYTVLNETLNHIKEPAFSNANKPFIDALEEAVKMPYYYEVFSKKQNTFDQSGFTRKKQQPDYPVDTGMPLINQKYGDDLIRLSQFSILNALFGIKGLVPLTNYRHQAGFKPLTTN